MKKYRVLGYSRGLGSSGTRRVEWATIKAKSPGQAISIAKKQEKGHAKKFKKGGYFLPRTHGWKAISVPKKRSMPSFGMPLFRIRPYHPPKFRW